MLTKNDLSQIKTVVHEVVNEVVPKIVEKIVDEKLDQKLDEKLKPINKKLDKIQKDLDATIRVFDDDIYKLRHRVDRIEDHLNLKRAFPT